MINICDVDGDEDEEDEQENEDNDFAMFSDVNSHDNLPPKLTLEVEPGGDSLKHLSNARKKSYENQLKKCLSCMSMLGMNNDERFVKINQIMTVFNGVQAPEHTRRCEKKEKEEECPELPEEMKKQLDAQIEAYTHIRKRIPVPQNLLKVAVVKKKLENVSRETFLKYFKKFDEECSVSIRSKLDFSKLPITPYDVKIEHESMIRQQMIERAEHLQRSIHDIAPHQQIPALIEMKALRLNDLQEMIRRQTLSTIERIVPNEFLLNPYSIRRTKEQYQRECRENPLKMSMERTRKAKNNEFLHCFLKNYREFREFHKSNNNRFSRVRKQMTLYHQSIAREKKRDELKNEKLRIQKLMQEDEEGYRAMLDEKKDQRLMHLLQQTDVYIDSLCNLVKQHQNSDGSNPSTSDISTKSMTDEYAGMDEETKAKLILEKARQDEDEYDNKTKSQMANYYATAHRIKEKITEQHQMMGGGDPNLKLKPYQIKGLEWMVSLYNNNLNGILADEMGLGKTIQTISFITYLMEKKRLNGPFLVIVPLSTLPNWAHEFAKWAPNVEMIPYKGTKDIRKNYEPIIKKGNFHVLLTTFEYVIKEKGLLGKLRWKYMIIDEGHRLKNNNCKLTLMLNTYFQAQNRLLITGTPLQNKLPELWALLNFLLPTIFSSCNSFEQWFNAPFATTGEKVELTEEETMLIIRRLHKVLRPFLLRRLKKEVESQLPDKMEFVVKCDMSALQRMLYRHMQKGLLLDGKHQSGGKTLMNTMMHLRKLCNHPFLFQHLEESCRLFWNVPEVTGEDLMRVSGKFELLDRIMPKLKATGHRILMFFQMTSMMTIVEDFLNYKQYKYLRLDGNTKSEERGQLLELFNAPDSEYFLFLLSTRAGGLGLNLQTADTVVIFDSDWNPHQDMQAQDRAHRIGQKQEVRVLRLITVNSVEEKILAAAKFKLNVDEKVIQAGKFDNRSTGAERKEILEQIIRAESEECEEDELPDDDAINEMISRNDKELEIFQAMDKARKLNEKNERPRLLTQEEIPSDILRAADEMEYQEKAKEEGREPYYEVMPGSRRKRKEVDYSVDSMTEEQFLQKIDQAEDDGTDSEANQNAFVMPQIIEKKVIEVKNVVDDEKRLHEHKKKEKKKHRDSDSDHEKEKKKKKKRKHGDDEDNERKLAKKLKREKERRDREKLAFDL